MCTFSILVNNKYLSDKCMKGVDKKYSKKVELSQIISKCT